MKCNACSEDFDLDDLADGLCEDCYFVHADPEWVAEHYPHLLEGGGDSEPRAEPRRKPKPHRKAANCERL